MVLTIAPWYRTFCYLKLKPVILTIFGFNRTVPLTIQLIKQWIYWEFKFLTGELAAYIVWYHIFRLFSLGLLKVQSLCWQTSYDPGFGSQHCVSLTPYRSKCSNESSKIRPSEWTPWNVDAANIWRKLYSKNKWHKMSFRMKNKDSTLDLNFCILFYFDITGQ